MEKNVILTKEKSDETSTFLGRFTKRFQAKPGQAEKDSRFGKTVGVIWESKGGFMRAPIACIVQIERNELSAKITVFDGNDLRGTSVTNMIEYIATGVYLEHLASEYRPEQIQLFHRDTFPSDVEPQWGTKPVTVSWNKSVQCFENPKWEGWTPDFEIASIDQSFVNELRCIAAVDVERWMREYNETYGVTPRQRVLYDRFLEHISAKSENHRYDLRGRWIYAPSEE